MGIGEDSTITIGLAIIIGVAVLALWYRIEAKFTEERNERLKLERDVAAYKVWVSQNHVSTVALRETKDELLSAIDRIGTRVETVVTRVDKLAVEILANHRT